MPKNFERILEEDIVLVAETQDKLVGFIQFGNSRISPQAVSKNYQDLRRLYVHPDFQNQGIGTLLMDAALDHPNLKNADAIFLDVWEQNHAAQRLYTRYGFQVIGERKFSVESGAETSPDLIMVRHRAG